VILQLAGFLPRGTLGHEDSLLAVRHVEDDGNRMRGRVFGSPGSAWPLNFKIGNALRCNNLIPCRESVG
jgi:hypothetical protein